MRFHGGADGGIPRRLRGLLEELRGNYIYGRHGPNGFRPELEKMRLIGWEIAEWSE